MAKRNPRVGRVGIPPPPGGSRAPANDDAPPAIDHDRLGRATAQGIRRDQHMTVEEFRKHWQRDFRDLRWPFDEYVGRLRAMPRPTSSDFWSRLRKVAADIDQSSTHAHGLRFHPTRTRRTTRFFFKRARAEEIETATTILAVLGRIRRDAAEMAMANALDRHARWWKGAKSLNTTDPSSRSPHRRKTWTDAVQALVEQVQADGVDEPWVGNAIRTLRAVQLDGSRAWQQRATAALKKVGGALWVKGKGRQRTTSPKELRAAHNESAARSAAVKRLVARYTVLRDSGMSKKAAAEEAARGLQISGSTRRDRVLRAFAKKIDVDWKTLSKFVLTSPRR